MKATILHNLDFIIKNHSIIRIIYFLFISICNTTITAQESLLPKTVHFETVDSEEKISNWEPIFPSPAEFAKWVSPDVPMTAIEVGDFFFGWRIEPTPEGKTQFTYCYYLKDPHADSWSLGVDLYFLDASGKKIRRVPTPVKDQRKIIAILAADFTPDLKYSHTRTKEFSGCERPLPSIPSEAVSLLCEIGGRRNSVRTSGSIIIPVARLVPANDSH